MINGLGVLGGGGGGIEAEAAMLGQPVFMKAPDVVGVRLEGSSRPGITATDVVLTITQRLRELGVVGKFVEYFGPGLDNLRVTDRATIANMAPEYGATMGFFPVDTLTLEYLRATGRSDEHITLVEAYLKAQGMFRTAESPEPIFKTVLTIDLSDITPVVAGPRRPQDKIPLGEIKSSWQNLLHEPVEQGGFAVPKQESGSPVDPEEHGKVIIAAITSCTNTSNPRVLLAAGLLAKKASALGMKSKPWVKTSFAPGSLVVTEYLDRAGLLPYLEDLGFSVVGYGCTTCIGNSGPVDQKMDSLARRGAVFASVLSGNRNFEGRISPAVKANFLASPPLVAAYALAGRIDIDITRESLGKDKSGRDVYLKDLWPDTGEIEELEQTVLNRNIYRKQYSGIEESNPQWNSIRVKEGERYQWEEESTYIKEPPFFKELDREGTIKPIRNARVLVWAGDSTTTDHISPAGAISEDSPAGRYLMELGVSPEDFNSYGSRRGNDQVMIRGTFANVRFRNKLVPGTEGSTTLHFPTGEKTDIFTASSRYGSEGIPVIVLAGKDYGMGSSRDWAAKGVSLLGVKAVLAESYERIHRSNLVGMGVLPLQFTPGETAQSLGLTGDEIFTVDINDSLSPGGKVIVTVSSSDGKETEFTAVCRLDNDEELKYYRHGGILQTVMLDYLEK
jgi:aconitate hydratase